MTIALVVLCAVALIVAGVLLYASRKPDDFEIKRSTTINAGSEKILPYLTDLRASLQWSPFEKDPNMKRNFSGAPTGKGSVYEWDGNREVGAGRITMLEATPSRVVLELAMIRPFKCRNTVEYTLLPAGNGTTVVWSMRGPQPLIGKAMGLFIDCEKMCGDMFEQGLASLKALAETPQPELARAS